MATEPLQQLGTTLPQLIELMNRLLAPDGCPWDREQTLTTLRAYVIEETYEVVDALDANDPVEHREELGDLLFQIVFQAALRAREQPALFGIDDVVQVIYDKLVRRHPHIFGDVKVKDSGEVLDNWNAIKAKEKGESRRRVLSGVPTSMPALLRAERIGDKAAKVNFDWPDAAGVRDKVTEEIGELDEAIAGGDKQRIEEELGDVLFALSRLGSKLGLSAEETLRSATKRFESRFATVEDQAASEGVDLKSFTVAEYEARWRAAKHVHKK